MSMKSISVLGSTGSIGKNTLKIIEMYPDRFEVAALSAKSNIKLLATQVMKFRPDIVAVGDEEGAAELESILHNNNTSPPAIVSGEKGLIKAASESKADIVVTAVVGAAGLLPTIAAIEAGKDIALANKETLVTAGDIVMNLAADRGVNILPVDSEHSAIFQSMQGQRRQDLKKILLTASGGPFFDVPAEDFHKITPADALNHPTWDMGEKITIDSATLMNKGLEVIEARHLFDVDPSMIEVVVHRQSIIHSMAAYRDGSVIAQLGIPDMRGAIAYALSCPERLDLNIESPDFFDIGTLTFLKPDMKKFPCLAMAYEVIEKGGTAPAVLNAANEKAVSAFLSGAITFDSIPVIIRQTIDSLDIISKPDISEIVLADNQARGYADKIIATFI